MTDLETYEAGIRVMVPNWTTLPRPIRRDAGVTAALDPEEPWASPKRHTGDLEDGELELVWNYYSDGPNIVRCHVSGAEGERNLKPLTEPDGHDDQGRYWTVHGGELRTLRFEHPDYPAEGGDSKSEPERDPFMVRLRRLLARLRGDA